MADFTTSRLVRAMSQEVTAINALTALTPQSAKVPIHFETDREVIERALISLALPDTREAKVLRIADTLSLEKIEVSEAYFKRSASIAGISKIGGPAELTFDAKGNLLPLKMH
jgi:hypothetical protein